MEEQSVIHNTFVIERSFPSTPERVFAAFSDPAKKRRWFAESDSHEVEEFEMDFRVGGEECASYRFKEGTPLAGAKLSSVGSYQDIETNRRIVLSSTMSVGEMRISVALATFQFVAAGQETMLIFTHQAIFFEHSDGPVMREGGWRALFERLAKELTRPVRA